MWRCPRGFEFRAGRPCSRRAAQKLAWSKIQVCKYQGCKERSRCSGSARCELRTYTIMQSVYRSQVSLALYALGLISKPSPAQLYRVRLGRWVGRTHAIVRGQPRKLSNAAARVRKAPVIPGPPLPASVEQFGLAGIPSMPFEHFVL